MTNPISLNSKPTPWLTKLEFLLLWTFVHALGGAFGILIGEIVIRSNLAGGLSVIAGFALFEGILGFIKHTFFQFSKAMKHFQGIDTLTQLFAGIIIVVGALVQEGHEDETIITISLNLLRFYGFLATSYVLTSQIPRFFNPETNQKRKLWFSHIKGTLDERPFLKLIALPFLALTAILLYVLVCSIGLVLVAVSFFIVLGPIEYLKTVFQDLPWLTKVIGFGMTSVGWIGFMSGLCYLFSFPKGLDLITAAFHVKRT